MRFESDQEAIAYHAARNIWKRRHELTPSGSMTWGEWYRKKFGESVEQAARRFAARLTTKGKPNSIRGRVVAKNKKTNGRLDG